MGTPQTHDEAKQMIRLVTRLLYESVRDAGRHGVPSSYLFMALEQHGCTAENYNVFIEHMKMVGLISDHPSLADVLVCPPGHENVANQLAL